MIFRLNACSDLMNVNSISGSVQGAGALNPKSYI